MTEPTQHTVKAIIKQYSDGATCSFIGEKRGMAPSAISRILKNAGVKIRFGRGCEPNKDTEFFGKTHGKAGRRCEVLPKLRNARIEAQITAVEMSEYIGKYPAWVSLLENGTMRPTSERLEVIKDAIEALDTRNCPTARAAAEERVIRFRDPDANPKKYAKRGTGPNARRRKKNARAAEVKVLEVLALDVKPAMKAKIMLALFGHETVEQIAT